MKNILFKNIGEIKKQINFIPCFVQYLYFFALLQQLKIKNISIFKRLI